MPIMVRKLYKNGAFLYKMNLVAGENGMDNLVKWVHIIEDDNTSSFLHGNELVFTTGIVNRGGDWLLSLAEKLHNANVSAFVVNIGPHINNIPEEVTKYCNDVNMPLFTIPWETKVVDMTRDFCQKIINNEHVENNTASTIKNIIFNIGDVNTQVQQMERYGYQCDSKFCFISITASEKNDPHSDEYKDVIAKTAEVLAKRMHELFITFNYKEAIVLVLVNYTDAEIKTYADNLLKISLQRTKGWSFYMGVSSNQTNLLNQKTNFEKALSAMKMARKRRELCYYYDKLGIYKVLYAINDKDILRDFYKDAIGKLEQYDKENRTQLIPILRTYLENNGSIQTVSEKQYVHRNTVTNQLKKIENITGYDPLNLEDKVRLYLAFQIKEIL
jgi:PucR family transcriptional regulator, proline-responsive transcriptional activator